MKSNKPQAVRDATANSFRGFVVARQAAIRKPQVARARRSIDAVAATLIEVLSSNNEQRQFEFLNFLARIWLLRGIKYLWFTRIFLAYRSLPAWPFFDRRSSKRQTSSIEQQGGDI